MAPIGLTDVAITDFVVNQRHGVKGLVDIISPKTLPPCYIQLPEKRVTTEKLIMEAATTGKGALSAPVIPVIDVSDWKNPNVAEEICEAAATLGFFQIVNHGVSLDEQNELRAAGRGFFDLPTEEKKRYWEGSSVSDTAWYMTSFNPYKEAKLEWRDYLKFEYLSDQVDFAATWPTVCREKESSSKPTCFSQSVTASNLSRGAVGVPLDFARRNGLNKGRRVIALRNQEGKTWESKLKSTRSGQVFICRNWRSFCTASKLKIGDSFQFKLLENTETPVFQLCSLSKVKPKKETLSESEEDNVVDKTETPRFVKITTTASSLEIGKQNIPVHFTRANKLNKPGKIVLVDKDKVEWSMKLNQDSRSGTMYIMGGTAWKSFCAANEVAVGESLTLELIRHGATTFKTKARKHKRARVQRLTRESRSKDDVSNQEAKLEALLIDFQNDVTFYIIEHRSSWWLYLSPDVGILNNSLELKL
ncbi:hypothetical protein F2Q68_00029096 [Brassica cretica]|uniref:TF-B3 domain-containing protein n=1 Tax=Brassica cretica TaxID=69181 RepID=A0A8S9G852_BRACR|nr:hypothetical protein F2Q68_00029096 [Brassica cretica]